MKILIAGAGGAPSEGVIKSLLRSNKGEEIIGMGSEVTDLILSDLFGIDEFKEEHLEGVGVVLKMYG